MKHQHDQEARAEGGYRQHPFHFYAAAISRAGRSHRQSLRRDGGRTRRAGVSALRRIACDVRKIFDEFVAHIAAHLHFVSAGLDG
jgi:hypothetical protein